MRKKIISLLLDVTVAAAAGLAAATCGLWAEDVLLYIAYYGLVFTLVPLCACVMSYRAARGGIPGLLCWLPGPVTSVIVYRAVTGMMFPGAACALAAVMSILGASAGEVRSKRKK